VNSMINICGRCGLSLNLKGIWKGKGGWNDECARLLEIVVKLLKTDADLDFLLKLSKDELKTLVGCIRERIELVGNK